jgi:hypothetical protein
LFICPVTSLALDPGQRLGRSRQHNFERRWNGLQAGPY